jgi:outer membrane protein OmpA-like peptidoglycan-associated protein
MVMRFLSRKVQDEGLSLSGLGTMLQRESPTLRNALPAGLSDLLWSRGTPAATASPVIAQSVQRESSSGGWLVALALGALALGGIWLWNHNRRPIANIGTTAVGEANRMAGEIGGLGDFVKRKLPNSVNLSVPENGLESRLLAIVSGTYTGSSSTWLNFDRLTFDSGSATLRRDSSEQVDNIAAILKAYPNVHLTLAGFTDDVGSAERNLELSRERAETVKTELVARGVSPDRLVTQGFGEQSATADNSGDAGRALDRRVSLQVTQR